LKRRKKLSFLYSSSLFPYIYIYIYIYIFTLFFQPPLSFFSFSYHIPHIILNYILSYTLLDNYQRIPPPYNYSSFDRAPIVQIGYSVLNKNNNAFFTGDRKVIFFLFLFLFFFIFFFFLHFFFYF